MWTTIAAAAIGLLAKIIDILMSEQIQNKLKEHEYETRINEARKALQKNDAVHVSALMADQHDRVLEAIRSGSGR